MYTCDLLTPLYGPSAIHLSLCTRELWPIVAHGRCGAASAIRRLLVPPWSYPYPFLPISHSATADPHVPQLQLYSPAGVQQQ